MTSKPESGVYAALPTGPNTTSDTTTYVVLPFYPHHHHRRRPNHHCLRHIRRHLVLSLSLILFSLSIFLLWPSDPDLRLVRVRLNHIRVHSSPPLSLDLSLSLTVRVRNRDLFSLDYDSLAVTIGYRGRELGFVKSDGGNVKARRSSYVDATLVLDGFEILHDFIYLIEDVAAGSVPFDTVSTVKGELGLFFFKIPIQTKVSCEVYINPVKQTIIHQNCYPE